MLIVDKITIIYMPFMAKIVYYFESIFLLVKVVRLCYLKDNKRVTCGYSKTLKTKNNTKNHAPFLATTSSHTSCYGDLRHRLIGRCRAFCK
jgi:hypothetical protein